MVTPLLHARLCALALLFLLALSVVQPARAQQLITDRAALGGTDLLDWAQFGNNINVTQVAFL